MVRIGEHVWKHRKKPKSRNRSAAHKNVRLAVTDRNDRREAIGTVQRIVLQRGIPSARRAERKLAQRERGQLVFREPREHWTDVAETGELGSGGVNDASWEDEIGNAEDDVEEALESLSATTYSADAASLVEETKGIFQKVEQAQKTAKTIVNKVNGAFKTAGDIAGKTGSTLSALRSSTDELINLLDDMRVLIDTTDKYVPTMLDSLSDSEELMNRLTRALYTTHDMLSLLNDTLISAGDSLDAGTKATLQGMEKILDKNLTMIDQLAAVREAGEDMKSTLDEQIDKFEDENNFLNIDPEAEKISFTSSKNPSPNSVQIVLRTDEISDDDESTDISDQEADGSSEEGPLKRMWNVLVAIVKAIIEIFQNR